MLTRSGEELLAITKRQKGLPFLLTGRSDTHKIVVKAVVEVPKGSDHQARSILLTTFLNLRISPNRHESIKGKK